MNDVTPSELVSVVLAAGLVMCSVLSDKIIKVGSVSECELCLCVTPFSSV